VHVEFDYDVLRNRSELRRYADAIGANLIGLTTTSYNARHRLTDLTHRDALDAVLADYDYDLVDRLISESHHGQTSTYSYDPTDQLTSADHSDANSDGCGTSSWISRASSDNSSAARTQA
jgi:YD repeat-containing protein